MHIFGNARPTQSTCPPGPPTNQAALHIDKAPKGILCILHFERGVGDDKPQAPGECAEMPRILSNRSTRPTHQPSRATETTPKKEYGALCTLRGVEGNAMDPKPQENVQKCQEFYHFRGRAAHSALFQHAIKLQDFD